MEAVLPKPADIVTSMTQARLKQLLDYDPETGEFRWKQDRRTKSAASAAGRSHPNGYWRISIDRKTYLAHRLAWLYVYGKEPVNDIDHIDGCKTNNRISNLREATRRDNCINRDVHRNGKLPGGRLHKRSGRWQARIKRDGKRESLGYFDTETAAHRAYVEALENIQQNNGFQQR